MNELLAFLFAAGISFWGSLQLGPVNVCVIQTALSQGKRQALLVATGGALPELLYASLAVGGSGILEKYSGLMYWFGWAVILLLLGLGIYYFFKPYRETEIRPSGGAGFAKGFLLALFNPQLFPFWLGVLVYLKGFVDLEQGSLISPYPMFVLGTAVGAWLLLYTFTILAVAHRQKLQALLHQNLNRVVGILFLALALFELGRRFL